MNTETNAASERVLVLAPIGRDAALVQQLLSEAGLAAQICAGMDELCEELRRGSGALLLTSEALVFPQVVQLGETLAAEPSWSDPPILVLTSRYQPQDDSIQAFAVLESHRNVSFLERPLQKDTLVRAAVFALEARRRQYQVRDLLRELRRFNEQLEGRVAARTRQVRRLASDLTRAEQRERQRISRILHDHLQQLLYGMQLKLQVLQADLRAGRGAANGHDPLQDIDDLNGILAESIRVTRNLTVDLSPPVLPDDGLEVALRWLAANMKELHGLEVQVAAQDPGVLPNEDLHVLVFQAVRELLFNVVKHAETERAHILIGRRDGHLEVAVKDDGRGFDPDHLFEKRSSGLGTGLVRLRERLGLLGVRFELEAERDRGTRAVIEVPLNGAVKQEAGQTQ